MKYFFTLVLALFLVGFLTEIQAQSLSKDSLIVKGKIISSSDNQSIPYANIFVKKKAGGTISNSLGVFRIKVEQTDTISVSVLGFHTNRIVLQSNIDYSDTIILVRMLPGVYELETVDIIALNRQKQLEYDLLHLEIPKDLAYENALKNFPFSAKDFYVYKEMPEGFGPISALYNVFSKEAKEQKRKKKISNEDEKHNLLFSKVDIRLIEEITQMSRKEINLFLIWCNFSLDFITITPDYELTNIIKDKCNKYKSRETH